MEITLVSVSERELRVIYMRGCVTFCECRSLSMKEREFSRASMSGTCSRAFCRNKSTTTTTTRRKKTLHTMRAKDPELIFERIPVIISKFAPEFAQAQPPTL